MNPLLPRKNCNIKHCNTLLHNRIRLHKPASFIGNWPIDHKRSLRFFCCSCINVTSSSSTSYCWCSEHWTKRRTQSGNIHSRILDVYVDPQSAKNFPLILFLRKLDKNLAHLTLSRLHATLFGRTKRERLVSRSKDLTLSNS